MKTRLNVGGEKRGRTSDAEGPKTVFALGPKMTKSAPAYSYLFSANCRDIMVTHRETAT